MPVVRNDSPYGTRPTHLERPTVTDTLTLPDDRSRPRGRAINWFKYAAPAACYPLAGRLAPWLLGAGLALTILGLWLGLAVAPTDAQQGEVYRIVFVHVPAAWLSMWLYLAMAFWAAVGLVFNTRLSALLAQAIAPTGALFTALALWTGAVWGKPTWGTWWVWDARLTSELLLLFLYLGFIALRAAIDDPRRADRAASLLALVGVVNLPVIYFSVQWWNTLHQGATIKPGGSTMAAPMLLAMLLTALGLWLYSGAAALIRLRRLILERERRAGWLGQLPELAP